MNATESTFYIGQVVECRDGYIWVAYCFSHDGYWQFVRSNPLQTHTPWFYQAKGLSTLHTKFPNTENS